jgi:hypothetical protein
MNSLSVKMVLIIEAIILTFNLAFCQEQNHQKDQKDEIGVRLSKDYTLGQYLIYDCKRKFFACVNLASYDYCEKERQSLFKLGLKKGTFTPCAPFKRFDSILDCQKEQVIQIEKTRTYPFCRLH